MNIFILFLVLVAQGSGVVTTAEFDSRSDCEDARATDVISFCVAKGGAGRRNAKLASEIPRDGW
jgi:hypothetical protein